MTALESNTLTPIPLEIIAHAAESDFIGQGGMYEQPCNYCGQSNGDHYYACPVAVQMRSEERMMKRMEFIQMLERLNRIELIAETL